MSVKRNGVYSKICNTAKKQIAVLIDPDKQDKKSLQRIINSASNSRVDYFMVGGSLLFHPIDETIAFIKQNSDIPLILFPGNLLQLSDKVDAILLLSLISGRNSELLIGNHVLAAPFIKKSGVETIPAGYLLISSGSGTSVEYMSNTIPIPSDKHDIATATAIAGELLGLRLIYLDAGSGAENPVPCEMIRKVKSNINLPLIVGGGLRNGDHIKDACKCGADILVIGNSVEKKAESIYQFAEIVHSF